MQNTIYQPSRQVSVSLLDDDSRNDRSYMTELSKTTGDIHLLLKVMAVNEIKSTGMVNIPSGVVTSNDVTRVLQAANNHLRFNGDYIQAYSNPTYTINNKLQTEFIPLGLIGQKLEVTIKIVEVPKGMIRRWHEWSLALGRNIVRWDVEIMANIQEE